MKLLTVNKVLEISMSKEELSGYIKTMKDVLLQLTDSEYKNELNKLTEKFTKVLVDARDF